ncbi:MAG: threonylcarbamoyl-AMP synthase [Actinobacteria bacterium]|nr:threonylcarbamoyl-AMP synthase [Actinomycetota bacterium]
MRPALQALRRGRPIVLPTDTVYGIGVMPAVPGAVELLFRAKSRPTSNPLPVLGESAEALAGVACLDRAAMELAQRFWPGPLTLVLRRAEGWAHDLGGTDRATVAVRVPSCGIARRLLAQSGPLAVSSANRSGGAPATTVAEARKALGRSVEVYIDGGHRSGAPSTVLSLVGAPVVLREGTIPASDLRR